MCQAHVDGLLCGFGIVHGLDYEGNKVLDVRLHVALVQLEEDHVRTCMGTESAEGGEEGIVSVFPFHQVWCRRCLGLCEGNKVRGSAVADVQLH